MTPTRRAKVALGIAVPLAFFVLLGGVTWYFFSAGARRPLTMAERAVLVTASDLLAQSAQPQLYVAANEHGEREDLLDGSVTLTAEYRGEKPPLYVVCVPSMGVNRR